MNTYYTDEKNTQIVIGLLKAHKIKKVVASPGTTNIRLVASMQQDDWFEMYSAPDERSAAYMACGLSAKSKEPVVLSCTGATASRNYFPGLTEAYYRKLPVLAITSTQHIGRVGQNVAQVLDRSTLPADAVKLSVFLRTCHSKEDEWSCNVLANKAILELTRNGCGPVHINLETYYSSNFEIKQLPQVRPIFRVQYNDIFPKLEGQRIGIFVGQHDVWDESQTAAVNLFCEKYHAIVLCDQTSNYRGKYRVLFSLVDKQDQYRAACMDFDLVIYVGNISGAYPYFSSKKSWRVNQDGEIRDIFENLKYVFQMSELDFFTHYNSAEILDPVECDLLEEWKNEDKKIRQKMPEFPFSNIWVAQHTAPLLPANSDLHLGILNSLRSWNFFETDESIAVYCNTGGFGIDGILSTAIGSALASPDRLVFVVLGDLAFFYDMNVLGNHHVPGNLRILLINNGKGTEFRNYSHPGAQFGDDADAFIAAADHYGNKSSRLVAHYAQDLGFLYISAKSKEEFQNNISVFTSDQIGKQSVIFEVFTDSEDESAALKMICNISEDPSSPARKAVKAAVRGVLGKEGYNTLKGIVKKK